jgi:hypothetical protein
MFTELRVHLPVSTPRGNGFAFAVIDYGQEHHLIWIVALDDTGEIWAVANPDVRVRPNPTMRALRVNKSTKGD